MCVCPKSCLGPSLPASDAEELDSVLQDLVRHLSQLPSGNAKVAKLRRIVRAARTVKSTTREALVASKADGNYNRLDLPVSDKIAEALVDDRLEELNERRNIMWRSGAVGALIAGAVSVLLWLLQSGGAGVPGN